MKPAALFLLFALPVLAADPAIDVFFERFATEWVRADPERATTLRFFPPDEQARLDAQLSDASDEGEKARFTQARKGLAELKRFDRSKLSPEQRTSADVLEWYLLDVINEEPFLLYRYPLNQFRGVQTRIATLLTDIHPVRSARDAENYLSRLGQFGSRIDQAVAAARARELKGVLPPAFILNATITQMQRFIEGDPEAHLLHTTLARKLGEVAGITPEQRTKYLAAAEKHIREGVYPSFQRAIQVLKSQVPKATDEAGLSRLPNGKEAYEFYLRRNTKGTATAEEIHGLGLREVARIEGEMDVLLRKLGYNDGSVKDRMQKLSDDTAYADEPNVRERILKDYNKIIQEATARLSSAFDLRPKASVIVQRIPEFQERNAAANYQSPPADGSRPGIFRVPLPGPKFYTAGMRTLAYHEAVPGHHFQIALGVETAGLPKFRRSSVFNPLSANAEGWALYAERLVSDLGWYKDDLKSDLGRLNAELFRARRLVVDTGLHAKRWTRQQGIDYGISESEVERYVVMPGQACSYKFGQLHILELREKARKALGGKFELKNFHNVVLREGLVPLDVLTRVVEDYIAGSAGPVAAN